MAYLAIASKEVASYLAIASWEEACLAAHTLAAALLVGLEWVAFALAGAVSRPCLSSYVTDYLFLITFVI